MLNQPLAALIIRKKQSCDATVYDEPGIAGVASKPIVERSEPVSKKLPLETKQLDRNSILSGGLERKDRYRDVAVVSHLMVARLFEWIFAKWPVDIHSTVIMNLPEIHECIDL